MVKSLFRVRESLLGLLKTTEMDQIATVTESVNDALDVEIPKTYKIKICDLPPPLRQ